MQPVQHPGLARRLPRRIRNNKIDAFSPEISILYKVVLESLVSMFHWQVAIPRHLTHPTIPVFLDERTEVAISTVLRMVCIGTRERALASARPTQKVS